MTVRKGTGKEKHSFGSRLDRFHYTPTATRNGQVGPGNYIHTDIFSPNTTFTKSSRFTFGVSRMSMKKSFIEEFEH